MTDKDLVSKVRAIAEAFGEFGSKQPINNAINAMHAIQTLIASADTSALNADLEAAMQHPTVAELCALAAPRSAEPVASECEHVRQSWNISMKQGHCKDCGALLGEAALATPPRDAAPTPAEPAPSEGVVMFPKIGAVPAHSAKTPGILALERMAQSIGITNKMACWDHMAMFEVRDALCTEPVFAALAAQPAGAVEGMTEPTPAEPAQDAKNWCAYVAGMVAAYVAFGKPTTEGIAGIIERRLQYLATPQRAEPTTEQAVAWKHPAPDAAPAVVANFTTHHFAAPHHPAAAPRLSETAKELQIALDGLKTLRESLLPSFAMRGVSLRVSQEDHDAIRSALAGASTGVVLIERAIAAILDAPESAPGGEQI